MEQFTLAQMRWLFDWMEREKHLMAAAGSVADKQFQELIAVGAVTQYDSMFGYRYYTLTAEGRAALRP